MWKPCEEAQDKDKPGLVVMYGTSKKKYRPLDKDILVLGRGASCDLGLVSPDVAPVHCVIVRQPQGWVLRDCSGRATRVNGVAVQEAMLRDGDRIQIGTFCFEAHLPMQKSSGFSRTLSGQTRAMVDRLQRSRKRLATLALTYRQRLRDNMLESEELDSRRTELEEMENHLTRLESQLGEKSLQVQKVQKENNLRAQELKAEAEKLQVEAARSQAEAHEQMQQFEAEITAQRAELQAESQRLHEWQMELHCRQTEIKESTLDQETLRRKWEEMASLQLKLVQEREKLDRERNQMLQLRDMLDRMNQLSMGMRSSQEVSSQETVIYSGFRSSGEPAANLVSNPESVEPSLRE